MSTRTKMGRLHRKLNDEFREHLADAMREKFAVEVFTEYAFLEGRLVTTRADGEDFTPEQHAYLKAYEDGFLRAMQVVEETP